MNKQLLTLVLALLLAPLTAQITLTDAYFPVAGDTLRSNTADSAYAVTIDVGAAGANQAFYFGTPTVANERSEAVTSVAGNDTFPEATLRIQTTPTTESYYRVTDTNFDLVGLNTGLPLLESFTIVQPVSPARPVRRAPLAYLDEFQVQTANSVTISPDSIPAEALELIGNALSAVDSLRITTEVTRTDVVDAWGTARLGDNFYDVLRERRRESVFIRVETKIGFLPFTDVTGTISVLSPQVAQFIGQQPVTVTYLYWNDESKEPIAEIATREEDGSIFNMNYKRILTSTSVAAPGLRLTDMTVFPNPASDLATLRVDGLERGTYTLTVVNMLGRQVHQQEFSPFGNQTRLSVEVSQFPAGLYLFNLRNATGRSLGTKKLRVR